MSEINILLLIVGLIISVFGWTLYWTGVRLIGLFVGLLAGLTFASLLILLLPSSQIGKYEELVIILFALLGSICGFIFIKKINNLLFFIIGAIIGVMLWRSASNAIPQFPYVILDNLRRYFIIDLIVAVLSGFITLKLKRYMIIIFTSFIGAILIWTSIFNLRKPEQMIFIIPIFAISVFVQTGWHKLLILNRKKDG